MPSDRMLEYYYAMGQDAADREAYPEAADYFAKAAAMGAAEAAHALGVIAHRYETGRGVTKDETLAQEYYEKSAAAGNSEAALYLGKLWMKGIAGNPPEPRKAKKYLEQSADAGDPEAAYLLGRLYDEGMLGRVNPRRAFRFFLLAAERDCGAAMLMVGLFYAQGNCVPKDLAAAELWIRKGAAPEAEDGTATLRTFLSVAATEYASGEAGCLDDTRALAMAEEAEKLGNDEAFLLLGETYRNKNKQPGHGEKAFQCFLRADKKHIPAARAALGLCYESGLGTAPDIRKAVACYQAAADGGNAFAMARLGYAYGAGEGIEKNPKLAMKWLIQAAMRGDAGAILTLRDDYRYNIR